MAPQSGGLEGSYGSENGAVRPDESDGQNGVKQIENIERKRRQAGLASHWN
jgi:hypothetical protein